MIPRPAVLHIISDWKWTGPAEPVVRLCKGLWQRGFSVHLACRAAPPETERTIEHEARKYALEPITDLRLEKRPNLIANRRDIRALAEILDRHEIGIVHAHSTHDHFLASRAAKRANCRPMVVRTNHTGEPLRVNALARWVWFGRTRGCLAYSQRCAEADAVSLGVPPEFAVAIEGAIDLERFSPAVSGEAKRSEFGFAPDDVVFGVVARIQPHRRFDIILQAFREAVERSERIRGLILGRGTRQEKLVDRPIAELGLSGKVLHPGYRIEDYAESVAAMDAMVFLVPGTDGSCRAAREAMALGKPLIVSQRGILPELVEDGVHGKAIHDTVENLAEAMVQVACQPDARRQMGDAAREKARTLFRPERQAETVAALYMKLAEMARAGK